MQKAAETLMQVQKQPLMQRQIPVPGGTDVSYLYDSLSQAVEAQDMDAEPIANEAISAAQSNKAAADDAAGRLAAAGEALNNSSAALSQAGENMERAAGLSQTVAGMTGTPSEAGILSDTLKGQLQEMSAGLQQIITWYSCCSNTAESGRQLWTGTVKGRCNRSASAGN